MKLCKPSYWPVAPHIPFVVLNKPTLLEGSKRSFFFQEDGFLMASMALWQVAQTLEGLAWGFNAQMQSSSLLAQAGTELVTEIQGLCNQALSQDKLEDQHASFSNVLWEKCFDFLNIYQKTITRWYEPTSGGGYFLDGSHTSESVYSASELLSLKNTISSWSNLESDRFSEITSGLSMTQQTYNVCTGILKSINELLSEAIESVSKVGA